MRGWVWGIAAAAAATAGCASVPVSHVSPADLAHADAQIRAGCDDCLREAHEIYARAAAGKARAVVIGRLFESDLLIALRDKELALDPSAPFAEAAALARELPADFGAPRALSIVNAVAPDDAGTPRKALQQFYDAMHAHLDFVDADLMWLQAAPLAEPVRQYLAVALSCSYPARPHPPSVALARWWLAPGGRGAEGEPPPGAPPLVRYRAAICGTIAAKALEDVRREVPGFVEAAYFLARLAVAAAPDVGPAPARALLDPVSAKFPQSPSVTYLDGYFDQAMGDCQAAIGRYDATIALAPGHEDAWLGRTACLSSIGKNADAIESATRMIDFDLDNADMAYYWRAWNRRVLGDLTAARADIERARALSPRDVNVLTLAGIIEHDQNDLLPAERDLTAARRGLSDGVNCTAAWYLGLVEVKREQWLASARAFQEAMTCYERGARADEAKLARLRTRTDLDPAFLAASASRLEAQAAEDRSQQDAAAYNAASQFISAGRPDDARPLVDVAAKDPALANQVRDLRQFLDRAAAPPPAAATTAAPAR